MTYWSKGIYDLLHSLLIPTLSESLKYEELEDILKAYYEPKPLVIAEQFHFHQRNQRDGESIAEYMAELRRLSTHCEFKTHLNEALCDRLVCCLRSESMQRCLLAEKDQSLQNAMEHAHAAGADPGFFKGGVQCSARRANSCDVIHNAA